MEKSRYSLSHELLSCPGRNVLFQQPLLEWTWGVCNGDRTECWKNVQKSQKLSIRCHAENVRTSVVGTCTCGTCASGCYCCTEKEHFRITGCTGDKYIHIYLLTLPRALWEYQLACKSLASLNKGCSEQAADTASLFSARLQVVWDE